RRGLTQVLGASMNRAATLALLLASTPVHAEFVELHCPERIETTQTIVSEHAGWSAASSRLHTKEGVSSHRGRPVGFSSGPASEGALLAPVGGRWPIVDGVEVWLVCAYADTTIELSRKIPRGSSVCGI